MLAATKKNKPAGLTAVRVKARRKSGHAGETDIGPCHWLMGENSLGLVRQACWLLGFLACVGPELDLLGPAENGPRSGQDWAAIWAWALSPTMTKNQK